MNCDKSGGSFSSNQSNLSKGLIIDDRYHLRRFLRKTTNYDIYEGIDTKAMKFITVYIRSVIKLILRQTTSLIPTEESSLISKQKYVLLYVGKEYISRIIPLLISKFIKNMALPSKPCFNTSRPTSRPKIFYF